MRCIGRSSLLLILVNMALLCGAQQVHPGRDIRWPPGCNNQNMVYTASGNTCINAVVGPLVNPGTQMSWPASCNAPNMTYNFASNSCFSTVVGINSGTTTTLPPGSPATVTQRGTYPNFILDFGIPTGTPGGSLSYPGVVTDNSSGLAVTGNMGATTTSASNNKVLYVMAPPYNAKCDGVTNDQTAIQAAFNDGLSQGKSIQFPAGTCLTSTISIKGQSFFGAGKGITFIKGLPGQDVFQSPDNNSFVMKQAATIHDLNIVVDTSVNAAATAGGGNNTFPNRIAGTVQNLTPFTIPIVPGNTLIGQGNCAGAGASATAATTSVSITCTNGSLGYAVGVLDPALVIGAPITINGAGASGGTYTGTITSISAGTCTGASSCTLAVTPAISTTVTNASGSMLNAQTPPWYIGNAGIALQCSNGNSCSGSANSWNLYNIEFDQSQTTYLTQNHCAGFFTQVSMYAGHFEKLFFLHLYAGYVEASPVSGGIGTGDTSSFKDMDFFQGVIPMVTINGNDRDLSNINFYAEYPLEAGPYFLTVTANASLGWTIHGMYMEGAYLQSGEFARFMKGPMHITGSNIFGGSSNSPLGWVEFQASSSLVNGLLGSAIKVDGNGNEFRAIAFGGAQIIDNGLNNRFYNSAPQGTNNYWGRNYNPAQIPNRDPLRTLDASFLLSGNSANPYINASDLLFTCADWSFSYNPSINHTISGSCVADPTGTEITRRYYQSGTSMALDLTSGSTAYQNAWAGVSRTFGVSNQIANGGPSSPIPRTKVLVSVNAQCVGATTCTTRGVLKDMNTNTSLNSPFPTLTFTNTWSTQTYAADLSSTTIGDVLNIIQDTWTGSGLTGFQIAFIGLQPIPKDFYGMPPPTLYSAAGTAIPACTATLKGALVVVSDATSPTYLGTYASGGAVAAPVMCNGTNWVTY